MLLVGSLVVTATSQPPGRYGRTVTLIAIYSFGEMSRSGQARPAGSALMPALVPRGEVLTAIVMG